ncbi:MAG: serine/threonine protein kinase [Wenzhouxiangella sp.]|nr:serine/threonine protein kinase [Wenzhouxiangella sp.]TVR96348.1 MAG: serine/threonine protein kinase [Wenzhouxiangellaceae bacterium]
MSTSDATQTYRRAKTLAMEALDQPPSGRDEWLTKACAGDAALMEEVRWLISAAEDASDDDLPEQFQATAQQVLSEVSLKVPLPRDYRLLRRLGEGGMSVVYLAERSDIGQQVALKLLQVTESNDASLARRLATERQILSRLNHPNIARLVDGGLTAEGRPFLATEYIDGIRIDEWCQTRQVDVRGRIELFLKVCEAVDYAHRHMVIHRDLKPSNILVTDEGEPRLLDFGIARLLVPDQDLETLTRTRDTALTLAYASPEQIENGDLTTATDVYSLGVVLYELLSGARPFDEIGSPHLMPSAILAGEIKPPSRAARERGQPSVSTDLDAIVLKALRRDAEQRYGSVRELAEDLQRFLKQLPVQARRGQALYRVRRLSWRHRWSVVAALLAATVLVVFMLDRESQLQRIAWERDRAEAVTEFMSELLAGADSLPSRGNEVTVREILDLGTSKLVSAAGENPAVMSSMYLTLGRAYNALGLGEQALPLLEEAQSRPATAGSLRELALIQAEIGAALDSAGRASEAIAADRQAMTLFEQAALNHEQEALRTRIRLLRNQANILEQPLATSIAGLESIVEDLERRPDAVSRELLFEALAALVGALVFQGDSDQALATARRAQTLAESIYESGDPRRLRGRYVYATALLPSDAERAVELYQDLISDHERLIGPSQRLANTIGNLGVALSRVGRNDDSMAAFSASARMIEDVAGRDHYLYRLSIANLAALHLRQGEPASAEALISDILPDLEARADRIGGVEVVYLVSGLDILGSSLVLQGQLDQAAESYRRALVLLQSGSELQRPDLEAVIGGRLAEVERALGSP